MFSKESKIAILVVISFTVLYLGFNYLKGVDFFTLTKYYHIVYEDIDGLTVSNPVILNGLAVGRVSEINILQKRGNKILITITVDNEILVGDSTRAILINSDLFGGKAIKLNVGNNQHIFDTGDTLIADSEKSITALLEETARPVLANLDETIVKMNLLFGEETDRSIKAILANFETSSKELKNLIRKNKSKVDNMVSDFESITASLKSTEKKLAVLLDNFNTISDDLKNAEIASTVNNANNLIKEMLGIMAKINKGEGSIGLLVHDDSFYNNLNSVAEDLDKLIVDLKKRPKRYVHISLFGGGGKEKKKKEQK
ncbi:MAG: MCE family protein [Bacteroidetes bacterium]|nr:MCE family protein [Bacteroidota bacterium]